MFHVQRKVFTNGARACHRFSSRWLMPVPLIGILGGCEAATPWVEPGASDPQQDSAVELSEDVPTLPEENERTTVVCDATGLNSFSSFAAMSQTWSDPSNGTTTYCTAPPCGVERGADAKLQTVTVHFDLYSYYNVMVLDEPIVTVTGMLKGSATAKASTKTFRPLTSIRINDIDHRVAVTVDTSDFMDITSASLSWISKEKNFGSATSQDDLGLCNCCAWDCVGPVGAENCQCTWWRSHCP